MTKGSDMAKEQVRRNAGVGKGVSRELRESTRAILVERFPQTFADKGQDKKPLKIGIGEDVHLAMPELSQAAISLALGDYTWGETYCRNVIAGAARIDLKGEPFGIVSEKEADFAAGRIRYFQKRREKPTASIDKAEADLKEIA